MTLKEMLVIALQKKRQCIQMTDEERDDLIEKLRAYAEIRFQKSADLEVEKDFVKARKREKKARVDPIKAENDDLKAIISEIMAEYKIKSAENGFVRLYTKDAAGKIEILDEGKVPQNFRECSSKLDTKVVESHLKKLDKAEKVTAWGYEKKNAVIGVKASDYVAPNDLPYPKPLPEFDHAHEIEEAKKETFPKERILSLALIKQQVEMELAIVDNYYTTAIERRNVSVKNHQKEIQDIDDMLAAGLDALGIKSIETNGIKISVSMKPCAPVIFDESALPDDCTSQNESVNTVKLKTYIRENIAADEHGIRETEYARVSPASVLIMS